MWLILLYPFAEIYAFVKFVQIYSFMDAVLFVVTSGLLGILLMSLQGKSVFTSAQVDLAQGRLPSERIIHRACIMLGGLLFLIPGFISDFFGLLLVLPGTRHLFLIYLKKKFKRGFQKGNVMFFTNMGNMGNMGQTRSPERDAQVVDVTPIEVTHQKIEPPKDSN